MFHFVFHSTIQYLGFGLSGSTTSTLMFGADATIAWVDGNGMAQAQDYYLSGYVQVGIFIGPWTQFIDQLSVMQL